MTINGCMHACMMDMNLWHGMAGHIDERLLLNRET